MASYTIYTTLLSVLFVIIHLPCPLTATEYVPSMHGAIGKDRYEQCYVKCMLIKNRFPCPEDSNDCGGCLYPIASAEYDTCEFVRGVAEEKLKLLDMIVKRDQGTGDIEVDTGNAPQPPEANQANPETGSRDVSETAIEGAQSDPLVQSQQSNAEVVEEPQPNEGSVILLAEWQFILIVCGCVAVAIVGVAVAFICWYKIQTTSKAQNEAEYPAYGVTGPGTQVGSSMNNGDRKLAQSAQMYHYQHQKQQMIAMEKREKGEVQRDASDYDSEEENEDGDLTVYECPGLAPTGEMQVKNPLFAEDAYPKPPAEDEDQAKQ